MVDQSSPLVLPLFLRRLVVRFFNNSEFSMHRTLNNRYHFSFFERASSDSVSED